MCYGNGYVVRMYVFVYVTPLIDDHMYTLYYHHPHTGMGTH